MEANTERKPVGDGGSAAGIMMSVIISSYNTRQLLSDCLRSIYRGAPSEPYEIIVIDDASIDGTSQLVRAKFPDVRLLRNEVNCHYSVSNNRGMKQSRGEYLLLLNSDTIVQPQTLDGMIAFLRMHPEAGAVGCRLLNEDGTIQWSVKSLPNAGAALFGARSILSRMFPNNRFSRKHLLQIGRDVTTPFAVVGGYVSGAAVMLPRRVIDAVGYLDCRLFYHVDADHCKRIADAGFQCWYLPTATVIHLNHKGGTAASMRIRFRQLLRFELHSYIYYRKHIRRSIWDLGQIVVPLGLFAHFLVLSAGQTFAELLGAMRSLRGEKASRSP
jgi:GT2 family glycosyltransferase